MKETSHQNSLTSILLGVFWRDERKQFQGGKGKKQKLRRKNYYGRLLRRWHKWWIQYVSRLFLVQVLKIVVDSWNFSMLLLFMIWDDWPIFTISGSKEQLQQELEYNWWISNMQSEREDNLEKLYAIRFCFKFGKNSTKTNGMLQIAFWPSCMNRASVYEWHKRFKEDRESVRDNDRCGRNKEVNTP